MAAVAACAEHRLPLLPSVGQPANLCYAYVQCVVEVELWHEMLCIEVLRSAVCVMLYLDGTLFVGDMRVPPLAAVIWCGPSARLPDQLGDGRRRPVVRFPACPTATDLFALKDQIEQAKAWYYALPAPAAAHHVLTRCTETVPKAGDKVVTPWMMVARDGPTVSLFFRIGDVPTVTERFLDDIFKEALKHDPTLAPLRPKVTQGERYRVFSDGVSLFAKVPFTDADGSLEDSRSTAWWYEATMREGPTPMVRHQRWVSSSWSRQTDRSINEHAVLREVLEKALCIDQLDVSNLCSRELCVRRRQLRAEAHRGNLTQPNYQGSEYWNDSRSRKGGIRVAPHLSRFVAEEQRQDNAIQKEKRNAAENGAAGAKAPPPIK